MKILPLIFTNVKEHFIYKLIILGITHNYVGLKFICRPLRILGLRNRYVVLKV
jgi:hypothetical protein